MDDFLWQENCSYKEEKVDQVVFFQLLYYVLMNNTKEAFFIDSFEIVTITYDDLMKVYLAKLYVCLVEEPVNDLIICQAFLFNCYVTLFATKKGA